MNKTKIFKKVVSSIAAYGSGVIVYAIIRNNIDYDELPAHKQLSASMAAFAIGGIVAEAVGAKTDEIIDSVMQKPNLVITDI